MNSFESDNYLFGEYARRVDNIGEKCPHERNYQELISDYLKGILVNTDIEVTDVSSNRNTIKHNRNNYTGFAGTPDLLLARGYRYENKEINVEYIAVIEVKVPKEAWDELKFINSYKEQLKSHLSINKKVIFTDCIKWCFFNEGNLDNPKKSFNLKDDFNKWKIDRKGHKYQEWDNLHNYIKHFINCY